MAGGLGLVETIRGSLVLSPGAFRLLLAVAVVASHLSRWEVGRLAVLMFFYLSGYWTARIWAEKFGDGARSRFYAARYLRIIPLYLVVTGASVLLLDEASSLRNWTLLGVAGADTDPIGVSWSLDIELQFYLLLPFLVPLVARHKLAAVAASALAVVAGVTIERMTGQLLVLKFMPAFVLGVLTFTAQWRPTERQAMISLGAFAAVSTILAFTPLVVKENGVADPHLVALGWMLPLLPYIARSLMIRSTPLDRHMGNISYPLYLVHVPVINVVSAAALGGATKPAAAIIAMVLSIAIYFAIDRPVDRWRVRMTESGQRRDVRSAEPA